MTVKNKTKQTIITRDLKEAQSFLDNALGLIRKTNPRSMLFKTHFGIHTFFLKAPIDVIVLDRKFKVVKIKENLQPNRFFFWNPKYYLVLELPKFSIRQSKTSIGDSIDLITSYN